MSRTQTVILILTKIKSLITFSSIRRISFYSSIYNSRYLGNFKILLDKDKTDDIIKWMILKQEGYILMPSCITTLNFPIGSPIFSYIRVRQTALSSPVRALSNERDEDDERGTWGLLMQRRSNGVR